MTDKQVPLPELIEKLRSGEWQITVGCFVGEPHRGLADVVGKDYDRIQRYLQGTLIEWLELWGER